MSGPFMNDVEADAASQGESANLALRKRFWGRGRRGSGERPKPPPRGILALSFFLFVPLILAAITATTTSYSDRLGYGGALLYVSHLSLIPWWIGEGTTRLAHVALRRYRPPLWVLCLIGILLASPLVGPYVSFVTAIFQKYWEVDPAGVKPDGGMDSYALSAIVQIGRATFFWISANYLFDRVFGYPRFRYHERKEERKEGELEVKEKSELIDRLSEIKSLSDILVVKAEEHYVRVFSDESEELINYRFGAALEDLKEEEGFQVHRSYWVRASAVVEIEEVGAQMSLKISDDAKVPVSRPYHALVRQVF